VRENFVSSSVRRLPSGHIRVTEYSEPERKEVLKPKDL
jgi:hypothetical protein